MLTYDQVLRPAYTGIIHYLDPALDYFLAKAGLFTLQINFSESAEQLASEDSLIKEEISFTLNGLGLHEF